MIFYEKTESEDEIILRYKRWVLCLWGLGFPLLFLFGIFYSPEDEVWSQVARILIIILGASLILLKIEIYLQIKNRSYRLEWKGLRIKKNKEEDSHGPHAK